MANNMKIMPHKIAATTSLLVCLPKTQINQTAVKYSGKAKNCLKRSIHTPGFGNQFDRLGKQVIASIGKAIPRPKKINVLIAIIEDWVKAKPSAVPIKGAVQGLATTVASNPVMKEDDKPLP